eukprot:s445_g6.t1
MLMGHPEQRRMPGEIDFECSSSFVHPKLEAKHQVVKWTADEGLCARLLPEGHLEIHQGSEISGSPALYKFARPAGDFEFAGRSRLAIFQADVPPLGRRGALIAPVVSLARGGPSGPPAGAPSWAQELGRFPGLFEDFEGPSISWKPVLTSTEGDRLKYPSWLTGSWKVDCKKRDVRFPQGWGVLSPQVPGVAMGSILRLPNVGAEPSLQWNFIADADGAKADWSEILPATLEGFWPDAVAKRMERGEEGWALTYASPTAMFRKVEWIRQTDLLQGQDGVADYKESRVVSAASVDATDATHAAHAASQCAGDVPLDAAHATDATDATGTADANDVNQHVNKHGIASCILTELSHEDWKTRCEEACDSTPNCNSFVFCTFGGCFLKTRQFSGQEPMHYSGFCSTFWAASTGVSAGGATLPPLQHVEVQQCKKGTVPEPSGKCHSSAGQLAGVIPKDRLWENMNLANLGGVMFYLHNEVVDKDGEMTDESGHKTTKFQVDRILRFKVTMRNSDALWTLSKKEGLEGTGDRKGLETGRDFISRIEKNK